MKRIFFVVVFLLIGSILFAVPPSVQAKEKKSTITVDLNDLDEQTANEIIKQTKERNGKDFSQYINPDNAKYWSGVAKGLGESVKELCKALNVEINAFLKTDAGKLLTFILVWKLFGAAMLALIIRLIIWITIIVITIISFRYIHMPKQIKTKDGEIKHVERYQWYSGDANSFSVFAHI